MEEQSSDKYSQMEQALRGAYSDSVKSEIKTDIWKRMDELTK